MLNYEFPPIGGGGGVISKEIALGLSGLGHQITIVTTWFKGLKEEERFTENLLVLRIKALRKKSFQSNPLEMADWIIKTKRFTNLLLQNQSFDLCFANFVMPGGEVALFLKKKFNLPFVVISHGHDIPWVNARSQWPLYLAAFSKIKKVLNSAEIIFIQTKEMEKNLIDFHQRVKEKVRIIPNGFSENATFNNYKPEFTVIAIGRLVGQKDPETYVKGFLLFNKEFPNSKLKIFGDGPKRKQLETMVFGEEASAKVSFQGKTSQAEVIEAMQEASVFLSTSLNEGMSLAMLEAAASGLALICTKVSGANKIVKPFNGILIDFKSPEQVKNALIGFYEKWQNNIPLIEGKKTQELLEQFNWKVISNQYHITLTKLS